MNGNSILELHTNTTDINNIINQFYSFYHYHGHSLEKLDEDTCWYLFSILFIEENNYIIDFCNNITYECFRSCIKAIWDIQITSSCKQLIINLYDFLNTNRSKYLIRILRRRNYSAEDQNNSERNMFDDIINFSRNKIDDLKKENESIKKELFDTKIKLDEELVKPFGFYMVEYMKQLNDTHLLSSDFDINKMTQLIIDAKNNNDLKK